MNYLLEGDQAESYKKYLVRQQDMVKNRQKRIFTVTAASKLAAWGATKLSVSLSAAVTIALNYSDIGTNIAKYIDKYDYAPNNGWLSI